VIVRADEIPAVLDLSSIEVEISNQEGTGVERVVHPPAGVSSAGLLKSPPNVEPLVAIEVPVVTPSFFSPSLEGPNRLVVVTGVESFFSSGFVPSLFAVLIPNRPPPAVAFPKAEPPVD